MFYVSKILLHLISLLIATGKTDSQYYMKRNTTNDKYEVIDHKRSEKIEYDKSATSAFSPKLVVDVVTVFIFRDQHMLRLYYEGNCVT